MVCVGWMALLPMHDFVTLCVGHLENTGSLIDLLWDNHCTSVCIGLQQKCFMCTFVLYVHFSTDYEKSVLSRIEILKIKNFYCFILKWSWHCFIASVWQWREQWLLVQLGATALLFCYHCSCTISEMSNSALALLWK